MTADGRSQIHEDIELLKLTGACDGQQARDGQSRTRHRLADMNEHTVILRSLAKAKS